MLKKWFNPQSDHHVDHHHHQKDETLIPCEITKAEPGKHTRGNDQPGNFPVNIPFPLHNRANHRGNPHNQGNVAKITPHNIAHHQTVTISSECSNQTGQQLRCRSSSGNHRYPNHDRLHFEVLRHRCGTISQPVTTVGQQSQSND